MDETREQYDEWRRADQIGWCHHCRGLQNYIDAGSTCRVCSNNLEHIPQQRELTEVVPPRGQDLIEALTAATPADREVRP